MLDRWCSDSKLGERLRVCVFTAGDAERGATRKGFIRMKKLMSWVPFVTEGSYMGLSREGSSVRDDIWVVADCRTPVLLSLRGDNPSQYEAKGEVCFDGVMLGATGKRSERGWKPY